MKITTSQSTGILKFDNNKRSYNELSDMETGIVQEVRSEIHGDLEIKLDGLYPCEFTIQYNSTDGSTRTEEIERAVQVLVRVCESRGLTLNTRFN